MNTNDNIIKKLEYIGLDLNNIPEKFKTKEVYLDFRPSRTYKEENVYSVYKFLSIDEIEILLTPTNRLDSLDKKYSLSAPLYSYLDAENENNIKRHTKFLKMIEDLNIDDIEKIEKEQESFNKKIPFAVKYHENYLWQIYYSEYTNKYFMLVPTEDCEYATFFYLLKKQIEGKKNQKIYVPISHIEYSGELLKRSEVKDFENYLWLFTKNWPLVYEVVDKKENTSIQIIGKVFAYEKIESVYNINLKNKKEAEEFYKLIKALFIIQTELSSNYKFFPKINSKGGLDFYYNSKKMTLKELSKFLNTEIKNIIIELKNNKQEKIELENKREELKKKEEEQEIEYLAKEKQIAIYMQCKKSFFGRVKYFLKYKKDDSKLTLKKNDKKDIINNDDKLDVVEDINIEIKENYTIEDLILNTKIFNQKNKYLKELKQDIKALESKINIMDLKLKNANIYLEEINKHKKSIFEFWKFTNKDNKLALNKPNDEVKEVKKISKAFDYIEDIEDFGIVQDKLQRDKLSKKELDSIYISTTYILEDLNIILNYTDMNKISKSDKSKLENTLKRLKEEMLENIDNENFDIFGSISEDRTKIKILNGKKHREIKKDKFKILDITNKTTIEEYIEILFEINKNIRTSLEKIKLDQKISVYKNSDNKWGLCTCNINPLSVINLNVEEQKIYIDKINLKEDSNVIFATNSVFFDNNNKTLPLGMNLSNKVILDLKNEELKLIKKEDFKLNIENEDMSVKNISVYINEYEI